MTNLSFFLCFLSNKFLRHNNHKAMSSSSPAATSAAPTVVLHGFGASRNGHLDPSQFVTKLHIYMRLAKIPYQDKSNGTMSKGSGRCPWAEFKSLSGTTEVVEDSERIVAALKRHFPNNNIDSHLTREQITESELLRIALENSLYHCIVRFIWVDNSGNGAAERKRPCYVTANTPIPLPDFVRGIAVGFIRKSVITSLNLHGNGDRSDDEVADEAASVLAAFLAKLGSKKFLFSDERPSSLDAAFFFYAYQFIIDRSVWPKRLLEQLGAANEQRLKDYALRVKAAAYPGTSFEDQTAESLKHLAKTSAKIATYLQIAVVVGVAALAAGGYFVAKKLQWM